MTREELRAMIEHDGRPVYILAGNYRLANHCARYELDLPPKMWRYVSSEYDLRGLRSPRMFEGPLAYENPGYRHIHPVIRHMDIASPIEWISLRS